MRITAHIPDSLAKETKKVASNDQISVSSMIAKALEYYIENKKRRMLGQKIVEMAGKVFVSDDVYTELERGRLDNRA